MSEFITKRTKNVNAMQPMTHTLPGPNCSYIHLTSQIYRRRPFPEIISTEYAFSSTNKGSTYIYDGQPVVSSQTGLCLS
ncbi:hypothetical protein BDR04DRAFT_1110730 [Suillus decipiens]|nr:hypothetical protein BDR04DRAFT_1110730 [Suillus decipiens]